MYYKPIPDINVVWYFFCFFYKFAQTVEWSISYFWLLPVWRKQRILCSTYVEKYIIMLFTTQTFWLDYLTIRLKWHYEISLFFSILISLLLSLVPFTYFFKVGYLHFDVKRVKLAARPELEPRTFRKICAITLRTEPPDHLTSIFLPLTWLGYKNILLYNCKFGKQLYTCTSLEKYNIYTISM